jgi:hypothetical protein
MVGSAIKTSGLGSEIVLNLGGIVVGKFLDGGGD